MIGCLEECISGILSTEAGLALSDVHSLLPTTLNVIHKSYDHCKVMLRLGVFKSLDPELSFVS